MHAPDKPPVERADKGQFKKGHSGNPGGRSGQTQAIRAKLSEGADAVTKKVLAAAKKGDMQACRLILERLVPPIKPTAETVRFELDDSDLPSAAKSILRAVAAGELPPDQGKALIEGLGAVARVIEVAELQKAVEELREKMEGMQQ
ncbi:DUF5681 domain-containing protein [Pseudomonas protegens]|uniref:DUF5681 domain-containing protein n=1 Tax=Pseudomonas TaxID=286 RepID=UPI001C71DD3F|nr:MULTISPECIES: DUF5681 domain-containing protein [Pseudomonas]MCL9654724.1 DUF5681 domain-containing protein [Pseudomonas protegens]MDC7814429.1 DUF5681 domain-containing protein [Pseudomonas sp. BLCC-B112]MDP9505554.1 DUF5681 domain-containing protein [Pseudomonas protegens]ULT72335.1 DUF5681 domain-containing protein [Pseudomonas sp. BC42]